MNYYEIEIRNSFIQSYKFHIKKLELTFPRYAVKVSQMVREEFKLIQLFPFSNSILQIPNDSNIYRKVVIDRKYHLIYTVRSTTISVLYFSDGSKLRIHISNY